MSEFRDGDPGDKKKGASPTRIGIWLVVGAVGVYMLGSGVIGILSGGS